VENPEGTGFDVRVGKVSTFVADGSSELLIDKRKTRETTLIADITDGPEIVNIIPGMYVLTTTIEKVNTPDYLVGIIRPRSTLFRSGIILSTGQITPGYCGTLTFGFYNASQYTFSLELGARIASILFLEIEGHAVSYRGQWQNGRVSAVNMEKQI
jgi:deoxycytidine triphosphate deaminase